MSIRQEAYPETTDDSSDDHGPESGSQSLNGTTNCKDDSTDEQRALSANSVPNTPSSRRCDYQSHLRAELSESTTATY